MAETLKERVIEAQQFVARDGNGVITALKRLEKETKEAGDDALSGNVCFTFARLYHYRKQYDEMMRYLHKSMRHLLRSLDTETLSRAYNLFGVNAQRLGCYDIAYNYYLMGYSFVEGDKQSLSKAILNSNLADLYAEMGEFKKACIHAKRALPSLRKHKEDALFLQNYLMVSTNLALYLLYDHNVDEARAVLSPLEEHFMPETGTASPLAKQWYLLFRIQIAIADKKKRHIAPLLKEVISEIVLTDSFQQFMNDTYHLCRSLIRAGEVEEAGTLIKAIETNDIIEASTYSRMLLSQLQIDYYRAAGNRRKLREVYAKRHALTSLHRQEEKEIYRESVKVMFLTEELRLDREKEEKRRIALQKQAETDELTGLPNRYALNRVLEETYERALKEDRDFGVGIVDIDDFKMYNDRFGHQKGDDCLKMTADALRDFAEHYHLFVARYGGDEFVIVYEGFSEKDIGGIEPELFRRVPVRVTHGYYTDFGHQRTKLWDYLAKADAHLYRKKRRR